MASSWEKGRRVLPYLTPNNPEKGRISLYLDGELKELGLDPAAIYEARQQSKLVSLPEDVESKALVQIIKFPNSVVITKVGSPLFHLFKPPGVGDKLYNQFVRYVVNKYGVNKIEEGLTKEYEIFMRDRVIDVMKLFGFKKEVALFDSDDLPENLIDIGSSRADKEGHEPHK